MTNRTAKFSQAEATRALEKDMQMTVAQRAFPASKGVGQPVTSQHSGVAE